MKKEDFDFIESLFWSCYYRSDGMYCEEKAKKIWSDLRKLQSAPSNSDYEKCSHVINLICNTMGITVNECDESNLHEIYHKIVEIKNVVKELSQHFA